MVLVKMGDSWSAQTYRQEGEMPSGPGGLPGLLSPEELVPGQEWLIGRTGTIPGLTFGPRGPVFKYYYYLFIYLFWAGVQSRH